MGNAYQFVYDERGYLVGEKNPMDEEVAYTRRCLRNQPVFLIIGIGSNVPVLVCSGQQIARLIVGETHAVSQRVRLADDTPLRIIMMSAVIWLEKRIPWMRKWLIPMT